LWEDFFKLQKSIFHPNTSAQVQLQIIRQYFADFIICSRSGIKKCMFLHNVEFVVVASDSLSLSRCCLPLCTFIVGLNAKNKLLCSTLSRGREEILLKGTRGGAQRERSLHVPIFLISSLSPLTSAVLRSCSLSFSSSLPSLLVVRCSFLAVRIRSYREATTVNARASLRILLIFWWRLFYFFAILDIYVKNN
jgi:hypothetical protein